MQENTKFLKTIENYVENYVGHMSTRHASEINKEAPPISDSIEARKAMSHTIKTMLDSFKTYALLNLSEINLGNIELEYKRLIKLIPPGSEIESTTDFTDYILVYKGRSFEAIKERIESTSFERSIGNSFLHISQELANAFEVEYWEGARMAIDLIRVYFPYICSESNRLSKVNNTEVGIETRNIIFTLSRDLQPIIEGTLRMNKKINNISQAFSLVLNSIEFDDTEDQMTQILEEDLIPFVEAYHLQERPYNYQIENYLEDVLSSNPEFIKSIMVFQMLYINYCSEYLKGPSGSKYSFSSLEPFSPIFIPCKLSDSDVVLAPNPKLVKTIINNWGGSIIQSVISRNDNILTLNDDDIKNGILNSRSLLLFRSSIAIFNKDYETGQINWSGILRRICPAENVFTEGGAEILPLIYNYLKNNNY